MYLQKVLLLKTKYYIKNEIFLEGFICTNPIYRTTPNGREITDLMIAVNRLYGKSDYIPSICWGRNAKYAEGMNTGDKIRILGRIQSREYIKRLSNGSEETRTAYEVSISFIQKIQ